MKLTIDFLKYHGCGNDFIIVDEIEREVIPESYKGLAAIKMCKRRFSVGADDLLDLVPSSSADAWMRIFEPDGSEADMCGNGIRCVAAYLCEKLGRDEVLIETRAGLKEIVRENGLYRVNMGRLYKKYGEQREFINYSFNDEDELINIKMDFPILGKINLSIVNIGEPHAVIFVNDVDKEDLEKYGEAIAKNRKIFPKGISVNLVQVIDNETIKVRTYERGVWGETLACGTGSTASAAVAYLLGKISNRNVKVKVKGGELRIIVNEDQLYMIGPAEKVFTGKIVIDI